MIDRRILMFAVLLTSVAPASAQLNFEHHPAKDPYRTLFATQPADRPQPRVESNAAAKNPSPERQRPVMMCGMLVVPADPSVDPKIRVGPREDGVRGTMRVVPPPACGDAR